MRQSRLSPFLSALALSGGKAVCLGLWLLSGCKRAQESSPDSLAQESNFHPPIVLNMQGEGPAPAYQISFRAERPDPPEPLVPVVADLVNTAMRACPAFAVRHRGHPGFFSLSVAAKKVRAVSLDGLADGSDCLQEQFSLQTADARDTKIIAQVLVP